MSAWCMIIPCFNEAKRLDVSAFTDFISKNPDAHFLFVNDGSKDSTGEIISGLEKQNPEKFKALNLEKNGGKAEAIRIAANEVMSWKNFSFVGYLDSDLSTPLKEINNLMESINRESSFVISFGSRISLMGRKIQRKSSRHYLGRIFATLASMLLKLPVYDTQCGAKLFKPEVISDVFTKPFKTRWFFDVEILFRLIRIHGIEKMNQMVVEAPLYEWKEIKGSKLKFLDFFMVPFNLFRIYFHYRKWKK